MFYEKVLAVKYILFSKMKDRTLVDIIDHSVPPSGHVSTKLPRLEEVPMVT